jgi:RNA polymerase sigma factor (sigma-70 family)
LAERDLSTLFLVHRRELEVYLNRQLRCRDTAADLLQETFLRLSEQPADASLRNVRAYLYQTARNLVIDHFRREERRQTQATPAEQLADLPDETVPIDQALAARQKLELLRRAMAELPDRTREIFELSRIEGLTYAEVARRLGISESSVQKHLAKALLHAMQCLKPR